MKKFLAIPCLFLLAAVLVAPPTAGAQGVAIKLFGGYNYMNGGDVKDGQKGILDYYTEFFPLLGYTAHQEYKPLRDAWDVGGDIIFYFTPNIGIGLGVAVGCGLATGFGDPRGYGIGIGIGVATAFIIFSLMRKKRS